METWRSKNETMLQAISLKLESLLRIHQHDTELRVADTSDLCWKSTPRIAAKPTGAPINSEALSQSQDQSLEQNEDFLSVDDYLKRRTIRTAAAGGRHILLE
jgi:hypothetical protein